jgi:hypothetical protein
MKELYKQLTETINSLPGIEVSGDNLSYQLHYHRTTS